jgi:5-methylcytosine-specific restriction enzyme subunit McrC
MLASDASAVRFFPPPTGLAPDADIFSFLVALLLDRVEHLDASGLYRAYVERESDLPLVRGRIMVAKQVARRADLKHRHECAYADLTADVAENRVLLAAVLLVPSLLHGGGAYEQQLVRRARSLALRMGGSGVTPVERAAALALLPGLQLHRLNAPYGPALGLSKLVLRHLSLAPIRVLSCGHAAAL